VKREGWSVKSFNTFHFSLFTFHGFHGTQKSWRL
jgi:hypothetical protein